jgi:ketosteroid isomerase-like protein
MSEEDAKRIRAAYKAFNQGGVRAILELLDPEIHVRERRTLPDRATYHGREGVQKMFDVMIEAFDDVQFEVEEVIDRDAHIVVVLQQLVHGRTSGIRVAGRTVHMWEMRNGRPIALTVFGSRDDALQALERGELVK